MPPAQELTPSCPSNYHCLTAERSGIITASRMKRNNNQGEQKMAHKIAADKCVACGCCKGACPAEAISEGNPYVIDPAKCVDCGMCASQCPNEAIAPE